MPEFSLAKNFPTDADHLPQVPFDHLGNFLFASADPAMSFAEAIGEVKRRLFWMPFDQLHFDASRSRDYMVNAHWALYCENYLELLHIPFVHKALRKVLDFGNYTTELYRYSNLQLALSRPDEESFVFDESKLGKGAGGELDVVEMEDEAVVESVQKGIRSRFYQHGRYSPSLETGTHHFHQLLCEFLNP